MNIYKFICKNAAALDAALSQQSVRPMSARGIEKKEIAESHHENDVLTPTSIHY